MDLISNCPNLVLSHILSFLPTKLAASTCVLSKRWQFLWTMIPNLDLEFEQDNDMDETATSFICFVNRFFSVRDKDLCLEKFRLKLVASCTSTKIVSWVLAAMSCDLQELDLYLNLDESFSFRCNIFTCKTLVVIKLGSDIVFYAPPSSIHFPSLKVLHLDCVGFEDDHSFSNLIFGCPILENLELRMSEFEELKLNNFEISSPTLIKVVVHLDCSETSAFVSVEAPSLKFLNLSLFGPGCIYFKLLDNLVEAVVDLESYAVKYAHDALYNVRVLKLGRSAFNGIRNGCLKEFPVFHNLVQLEIDGFCSCWGKLQLLLQKIPYLQHLTLHLENCYNEAWGDIDVPNCLSHLRTFCLYSAYAWVWDNSIDSIHMKILTYMLKNSTALEDMTIVCQCFLSPEKMDDLKQRLASLERGSNKCILKFQEVVVS